MKTFIILFASAVLGMASVNARTTAPASAPQMGSCCDVAAPCCYEGSSCCK